MMAPAHSVHRSVRAVLAGGRPDRRRVTSTRARRQLGVRGPPVPGFSGNEDGNLPSGRAPPITPQSPHKPRHDWPYLRLLRLHPRTADVVVVSAPTDGDVTWQSCDWRRPAAAASSRSPRPRKGGPRRRDRNSQFHRIPRPGHIPSARRRRLSQVTAADRWRQP